MASNYERRNYIYGITGIAIDEEKIRDLSNNATNHLPGRLGLANPLFGPWSCGGYTSSCNLSRVISSGESASI